jgi:hypothetical protein
MQDEDLAKTILMLVVLVIALSLVILYILAIVSPKGYLYLLYPFKYIFFLYQLASPGEKLSAIFLLIGGVGGWFLKQWTTKKL